MVGMEDSSSLSPITWLLRVAATLAAVLIAFIVRRAWGKAFREYDRSMLLSLGTERAWRDYADKPLIVGQIPFSQVAGGVESDLDVRNVIGFVIGKPRWLTTSRLKRLRLDLDNCKPGYYAYCVVQWERADFVKRLEEQWFHVRRTRYDGPPIRRPIRMRERVFLGFGTDSEPDPNTGEVPFIAHLEKGLLGSFKYQPYRRGGFNATDLKMRALAPQTKFMIRFIKDSFTKEWRYA